VNARVRGRKGARLTAITSGGAIPDTADYRVILQPEETFVGTVNEDFAIESNAGDIIQLGNASWRILKLETGVLRVARAITARRCCAATSRTSAGSRARRASKSERPSTDISPST
jgi:Lhr-like helicase